MTVCLLPGDFWALLPGSFDRVMSESEVTHHAFFMVVNGDVLSAARNSISITTSESPKL